MTASRSDSLSDQPDSRTSNPGTQQPGHRHKNPNRSGTTQPKSTQREVLAKTDTQGRHATCNRRSDNKDQAGLPERAQQTQIRVMQTARRPKDTTQKPNGNTNKQARNRTQPDKAHAKPDHQDSTRIRSLTGRPPAPPRSLAASQRSTTKQQAMNRREIKTLQSNKLGRQIKALHEAVPIMLFIGIRDIHTKPVSNDTARTVNIRRENGWHRVTNASTDGQIRLNQA